MMSRISYGWLADSGTTLFNDSSALCDGSLVGTNGGSSRLLDGMNESNSRVILRACSSESAAKWDTPDFVLWVIAPPSSSLVTSSWVTVLMTSGPVMNM